MNEDQRAEANIEKALTLLGELDFVLSNDVDITLARGRKVKSLSDVPKHDPADRISILMLALSHEIVRFKKDSISIEQSKSTARQQISKSMDAWWSAFEAGMPGR